MSSNACPIALKGVWKKYSRNEVFHRSLREDIVRLFRPGRKVEEGDLGANEFWALQNIDLTLKKGEAVGLYGHNGAGKSTILKLLSGVTYPNRGEVVTVGKVAPLIEVGAGFHPDLTGRENVFVNGAILGMGISEIRKKFDSILDFSELTSFIDMPVKKYSSGMYLRLAFSIAIHSDAEIFLIDEIISVGDEEFQKKCIDRITMLKQQNKTLILVSHDMSLLHRLSSRIVVLSKGAVVQETSLLGDNEDIVVY